MKVNFRIAARRRIVGLILSITAFVPLSLCDSSLYEQSLSSGIASHFSLPGVSYVLLDARTGRVLDLRWDESSRPVPVGSLVKPFTALAYAESHHFTYPVLLCRGGVDGCWLSHGHGRIGMKEAIAQSCNAYFRQLAREVRPDNFELVAHRFGMPAALEHTRGAVLVGLGVDWQVAPVSIARAYCQLAERVQDPGVTEVIRGMALSGAIGTGRAVDGAVQGFAALVKTGTAPCVHAPPSPGDGYTIALWPAESPRFALLVRVHGVPGAQAAAVCGRMLRAAARGN
jgi:cell division protein FtsI/penicillin-binding protein 2